MSVLELLKRLWTAAALGLLLALISSPVRAQLIDDIEVRREGADAVVRVRFATAIQFARSVTTRSGDLVQVFYGISGSVGDVVPRGSLLRRLGPADGLPELALSDEQDRGERNRKLVLRLASPTRVVPRAGPGNRAIDLVFPGMGGAVARAAAAAGAGVGAGAAPRERLPVPPLAVPPAVAGAAPAGSLAGGRYIVNLQRSAQPDLQLRQPVPSSMQDYTVFSSRRVVEGATLYEINLGYFETRERAEQALRVLKGRFPQAAVAEAATPPGAPAAALPVAAATPAPTAPPAPIATPTPMRVPGQGTSSADAAASAPMPPAAGQAGTAAPAGAARAGEVPIPDAAEIEKRAGVLLASARQAYERQDYPSAFADLNELLNLPPNTSTRDGQELAGMARLRSGDLPLARAEFETYLALYPKGPGAERVRRELGGLPAVVTTAAPAARADGATAAEPNVTGSASLYHYGGNGRLRSQDFKDSPLSGLPEAAGDPLFAPDRSSQLSGNIDLAWRQRDDEQDLRFVLQDNYTADLRVSDKSRNRLSALYADYRSLADGYGLRIGRQSPSGAGNFNRFDGIQANYTERRRWKVGLVGGVPSESLFDAKRRFFGASAELESLAGSMGGPLGNLGASVYANQHMIDGEIDRRSVGLELRYFHGGVSVFSQFDYDLLFKALNIASAQGTWILGEETTFNALFDQRTLTPLALGNALTFLDTGQTSLARSIRERLAQGPTTVDALREQIRQITPKVTQAQVGMTHFLTRQWQFGANAQLTRTGAVPPVPSVSGFERGIAATGDIVSLGGQLIGLNLYSSRDTSVAGLSLIQSPGLRGWLFNLNNSTVVFQDWQLEPSLQFYADRGDLGGRTQRWTPGLRLTYRGVQRWSVETGLTYERGRATLVSTDAQNVRTTTEQSTSRTNYSLGARYEF